jgi:hypothetical protein
LLFSTIAVARTVRAYCAQFDRPIASISTNSVACSCWAGETMPRKMPKTKSATRMAGKDSWMSAMRMISASVRPPT